jgi:hypothetical protein
MNQLCIYFDKKRFERHFWRLFDKLIWSPCSQTERFLFFRRRNFWPMSYGLISGKVWGKRKRKFSTDQWLPDSLSPRNFLSPERDAAPLDHRNLWITELLTCLALQEKSSVFLLECTFCEILVLRFLWARPPHALSSTIDGTVVPQSFKKCTTL